MPQPLEDFPDPFASQTWGELGAIRHAAKLDDVWHAEVHLGYPYQGVEIELKTQATAWLGEKKAVIDFSYKPPVSNTLPTVNNVVAVASGKGGVGKSTTAVNLALGLAKIGAKVGLLDADIYGPSIGLMMGIPANRRPEVQDNKHFLPMRIHGIETISMSMLVTEKTPMVWRGPMASGALQQLLNQTKWSDLDYLVVDMPPGTGDIQLTLSQQVAVTGAVIVTTPQNIAVADAVKGIEMFQKVNIPILGIVENMSYFECDGCGKQHSIFDSDGGQQVADAYKTNMLGAFPLHPMIRFQTDSGDPPVVSHPDSEVARMYQQSARLMAAKLWANSNDQTDAPTISFDNR